jgi:hypothetical protein
LLYLLADVESTTRWVLEAIDDALFNLLDSLGELLDDLRFLTRSSIRDGDLALLAVVEDTEAVRVDATLVASDDDDVVTLVNIDLVPVTLGA